MAQLTVTPEDLRFTQDSIAIKFRSPYDHLRVDEAVEQIQAGLLTPDEFTTMNVVKRNGILWCLDNRRLWVFRKARVQEVIVNIVDSDYSQRSETFFTNLNSELERQYSSRLFYPRVRGKLRSNFNSPVPPRISAAGSSSNHAAPLHTARNPNSPRLPKLMLGGQYSRSAGPAAPTQTSNPTRKTHVPSSSSSMDLQYEQPVFATTGDPNSATMVDSLLLSRLRNLFCKYDGD